MCGYFLIFLLALMQRADAISVQKMNVWDLGVDTLKRSLNPDCRERERETGRIHCNSSHARPFRMQWNNCRG